MKHNALTAKQLKAYCRDAQDAVARSHWLWKTVNMAITGVLKDALRKRHSRQQICSMLMKMAGVKQHGEPVAIESFRAAARQIAGSAERLTLI